MFPDFNMSQEQEKQEQQKQVRQAKYLEYLEMASHDKFRVYNPLEEDFFIEWGGVKHLVPGKNRDMGYGPGQMRVERFLMAWYSTHMTDKILNMMNDKKIDAQLKAFTKSNPQAILTPYEQNQKINDRAEIKLDDVETRKKIIDIIILGLEERYGQLVDDAALFDKGTQNDLTQYAQSRVFNPEQPPQQSAMIPPTKKGDELPHRSTADLEESLGIKPVKTSKPSVDEV